MYNKKGESTMGIIRKEIYNDQINKVALSFDLLSHPGRIAIIMLLLLHPQLSLSQIQEHIPLSQSSVSDQVRKLKDNGLLNGKPVGTSVYYSLNKELWQDVRWLNEQFWQALALENN
jgi:ArsR family transcriptional regulator